MSPQVAAVVLWAACSLATPASSEPLSCPPGPRPLRIGEEVTALLESAHPYGGDAPPPAAAPFAEVVTAFEIAHVGATYVSPHFAAFNIEEGDFVVVRSPDRTRMWRYDGGPTAREPFWGISVPGPLAVVELHRVTTGGRYGFRIDRYARGLTSSERASDPCQPQTVCEPDDSNWAACYSASEPSAYNRGRTVARLTINGVFSCTGWLIGSQGHLITNHHCIGTAADAANTQVEFMAEGATCGTDCAAPPACPGTIEAVSTTFVKADQPLDYALVKPVTASSLPSKYGYLQVRASGALPGERIYIPQHPQGWGKRFAVQSSQDPSGFAEVATLTQPSCSMAGGPLDVGYYADTQGGSSGSPVLGYTDHRVVALHHCGGCPNGAVPIQDVLGNLGASAPPCAVPAPGCPPNGLTGGAECTPCSTTQACPAPAACVNGRCVTASFSVGVGGTCCDGQQCRSHSCSSGGTCECLAASDCPVGETCVLGNPNTCRPEGKDECEHCTLNKECTSGVCWGGLVRVCIVPKSKAVTASCCKDRQCISGRCGPFDTCECTRNSDCPGGFYCEHGGIFTGNVCVLFKESCDFCTANRQCPPGYRCDGRPTGRCITGQEGLDIGESCCRNDQCKSGSCPTDNSVCQCARNSDCPSGQYCALGFLGIGKNKCVAFKAECECCTASKQCGPGALCKAGKCATGSSVAMGGACCRDYQCTTGSCNSKGVCQCTRDNQCPQGQYCAEGFLGIGKNTCVDFKAECDGCTLSSQCGPGALCKLGLCAKGSSVGIGGSCCRDYQCTTGSCNSSGICQCTQDNQCPQGQYCAEGFLGIGKNTCVAFKADCDGCTLSSQCGPGALCRFFKCATHNSLSSGQSCCRDWQCTSGNCKGNGKCK